MRPGPGPAERGGAACPINLWYGIRVVSLTHCVKGLLCTALYFTAWMIEQNMTKHMVERDCYRFALSLLYLRYTDTPLAGHARVARDRRGGRGALAREPDTGRVEGRGAHM